MLSTVVDDRPACERVAEWIERNNDSLPVTLEALVTYPANYRRRIVAAQPPEIRSEIWREHLTSYLEILESAEQRSLVREVLQRATPAGYMTAQGAHKHWAEDFMVRARVAFGSEKAREIFGDLGPSRGAYWPPAAALLTAREDARSIAHHVTVSASGEIASGGGFPCDCKYHSDCGGSTCCPEANTGCSIVRACGPAGIEYCLFSCIEPCGI